MNGHPVRVAHIVLSLDPGGTETLVIDLVKRMKAAVKVRVYCLDAAGGRAEEVRAAGVALSVIGRKPGFDIGVASRLRAAARADGLDVIHCHQYTPFVYGRLAALAWPHLGVVFTEHGRVSDAPPSRKRRMANVLLGRLPCRMFAVSENLREFMAAEGLPASRIEILHNGIDPGDRPTALDRPRARAQLGIAPRAFAIGTAARLDPVKDIGTLLRAFASVRQVMEHAELVIAGDGPERATLEQVAVESGAREGVHFLGHRSDVRALLPGLDVFVNSSISEGTSVTILEAMAAGLPVVATRVGGTPEVVVDTKTGLLIPCRDPQALSSRLCQLAGDAALRTSLGRAGRERVIAEFTAKRMTDRYLQAYRDASRGRA